MVKSVRADADDRSYHTSPQFCSKSLRSDQKAVNDRFGAVAIGRNEGERLKRCLESLSCAAVVVYVDSDSADGSVEHAQKIGRDVLQLDMSVPFTAARARNAGFRYLRRSYPDLPYVQFIDGDCELNRVWPERAVSFLDANADVVAVCGRLIERFPDRSVYNWLCSLEWDGPAGEVRAFGGNVMIRASALEAVGGYRDDLVAGEEPELGVRLRARGWQLWRLNLDMAIHDADMRRFSQWWRRAVRSGYAFAHGAHLHGGSPEHHFLWESRRAWLWGLWLPLGCMIATFTFWPVGLMTWLFFPLQLSRQIFRNRGPFKDRAVLAFFQILARPPEALGQIKFMRDRLLKNNGRLIEYK